MRDLHAVRPPIPYLEGQTQMPCSMYGQLPLHPLQLQFMMVAADVVIAVSAQTSLAVAGMHLILFSNVIRVARHP